MNSIKSNFPHNSQTRANAACELSTNEPLSTRPPSRALLDYIVAEPYSVSAAAAPDTECTENYICGIVWKEIKRAEFSFRNNTLPIHTG